MGPSGGRGRVVAVGFFDGVHLGHQRLLQLAVEAARVGGGEGGGRGPDRMPAGALTFWPHPMNVLRPAEAPPLLMTLEEKERAIAHQGLDFLLVQPFTPDFARLSPRAFLEDVLVDAMAAETIVVGFNFSFGAGGSGNANWLAGEARRRGLRAVVVPPVAIDDEVVSSSTIRDHIREGRVERAAALLGYPFHVRGTVRHGDGRGHTIGFPTANVTFPEGIVAPAAGVYAVDCVFAPADGAGSSPGPVVIAGVANVGRRPTFYEDPARAPHLLEVHLLNFSGDVYGSEMEVSFRRFLRPERAFPSVEALVQQIKSDVAVATEWFSQSHDGPQWC